MLMASSTRVQRAGVEGKNLWSRLDIASMVLPPYRCDMDTPWDWGVVPSPAFPGVLVSALRLSVSGENSRSGRKKCGRNKSVYVTVSVSEDGAQTTCPGGVRGALCAASSAECWLGWERGPGARTHHTRALRAMHHAAPGSRL